MKVLFYKYIRLFRGLLLVVIFIAACKQAPTNIETADILELSSKLVKSSNNIEPSKPFQKNECFLGNLFVGMTKEDVLKIIGEPNHTEITFNSLDDSKIYIYSYEDIDLQFSEDFLIKISSKDPDFEGPRGIALGMPVEKVLAKFPNEKNDSIAKFQCLYGCIEENKTFGGLYFDDSGNISKIVYSYGNGSFDTYAIHVKIQNGKAIKIEAEYKM